MAAENPRASTHRLAIASCALGMLTYVGIKSLVAAPPAPPHQAEGRPREPAAAPASPSTPVSFPSSLRRSVASSLPPSTG